MSALEVRAKSVDEVAAVMRDASAAGKEKGVRIRGGGSWMDAGGQVDAALTLDLGALGGVHEYTPDDLTISVGAAMTLGELDEVTRAHGQWCPLLAWGDDNGTVGATVATGTAGPAAAALGRPRDLVIGLECVDGAGRTLRAGGRVVKNVAGFDLTRLMTGQWGTLAAITAVNLRLRARPVVDESFTLQSAERDEAVAEFARGPYAPLGCVRVAAGEWLVRFGGNRAFVDEATRRLRELGECTATGEGAWHAARRDKRLAPAPRLERWKWDDLSMRLKNRFDPAGVLNPGLLGGRVGS